MPVWTALGPLGSDKPTAIENEFGHIVESPDSSGHDRQTARPLYRFDAETLDQAVAYFVALRRDGIKATARPVAALAGMWRTRGAPHYNDHAGAILGVSQVVVDRVKYNEQSKRIQDLLGQLNKRYFESATKKENFQAVIPGPELSAIEGTLREAENEYAKLHVLAKSAELALNEGWAAFRGLRTPDRAYRVVCKWEESPPPSLADSSNSGQNDTPLLPSSSPTAGKPKHSSSGVK